MNNSHYNRLTHVSKLTMCDQVENFLYVHCVHGNSWWGWKDDMKSSFKDINLFLKNKGATQTFLWA